MSPTRATRSRLFAAALVVAVVGVLFSPAPAEGLTAEETAAEVDYVTRINNIRKQHGLRPLVEDPQLVAKARGWSHSMAHGACGGGICHDPNPTTGITTPWSALGENVGHATWGWNHVLMDAFMGSAPHRANLLDSRWTRVGVGVTRAGGSQFVVHKFMAVPGEWISHNAPSSQRYFDVRYDMPFYSQIEWLAQRKITTGFADRSFRPLGNVTRQAMAAFLYRIAGSPPGTFPNPGFRDVPTSHPFYREIAWLASSGITSGFPDGTFRGTLPVTRQAMASYLYRMAGSPSGFVPNPGFRDVSTSHPFYREIAWLAAAGITTGYSDGTFRPAAAVKRQAMAAFLARFDAMR